MRPRRSRRGHTRLLIALGAGLALVVAVLVGVSVAVTPGSAPTSCPPSCPRPPIGPPVRASHTFTSSRFGFSVSWFDSPSAKASTDASSVTLTYPNLDGQLQIFALRAAGATSQQVVEDLVRQQVPDARRAYQLPGASVGYTAGYGAAYDVYPNSGSGTASHDRLIVLATTKGDLTVVAVASGPYRQFSAEANGLGDGHPSPAALPVALAMDPVVNSVLWPGDPAR